MALRARPASLPLVPLRPHPLRQSTAVWAVGRYLFAYDTKEGRWEQCRKELHSDSVRSLDALAPTGERGTETLCWVSAGDDKQVVVWHEREGQWASSRELSHSKKLVAAIFDRSGLVLLADRFGDVCRWNWRTEEGEPQLLFTHLAIVTAMVLTESGKFLVTADNHEKVRVSCYPEAFEIHSFCLGHTAQITALTCLGDEALASTSTDGTLRVWQLDGEQTQLHDLGAPLSSLANAADGTVILGCEGAPGLRRVSLQGGDMHVEPEALADELPQAVCVLQGNSVVWVDRAGHLRLRPATGEGWEHAFQGEDLPPALVCLSKNADPNWCEEAGGQEEGAEPTVRPRKRRTK